MELGHLLLGGLVMPFSFLPENKKICKICHQEFKENRFISKLKCGHIFHEDCIVDGLVNQKSYKCPTCHKVIEVTESSGYKKLKERMRKAGFHDIEK